MNRFKHTILVVIAAAALATMFAGTASGKSIMRCESVDGRRHECRFEGAVSPQLSQQLSRENCVKGRSWGVDGNTIWVDRGCRAEFAMATQIDRSRGGWDNPHRTITVVCESKDGRRQRCAADTLGQVTLGRELSRNDKCVEGRSWGTDSEGIWVDRGCRAEFLIADNSGTYRDRGPSQAMRTVVCESNGRRRSYCAADTRFGVRLMHEISTNNCVVNRTWGSDRNGVWVSNGCRAEFSLKTRL